MFFVNSMCYRQYWSLVIVFWTIIADSNLEKDSCRHILISCDSFFKIVRPHFEEIMAILFNAVLQLFLLDKTKKFAKK